MAEGGAEKMEEGVVEMSKKESRKRLKRLCAQIREQVWYINTLFILECF